MFLQWLFCHASPVLGCRMSLSREIPFSRNCTVEIENICMSLYIYMRIHKVEPQELCVKSLVMLDTLIIT